jgi:hypothetical protein
MESLAPERTLSPRFTLDGSVELERRLADLCETVRRAALRIVTPERLEGLVLGGGYGRGQGGVLETKEGDAPYNDLEFYVFFRGNRVLNEAKYRSKFQELGDCLSPEAGLHVEFKIDSLAKLRRRSVSIFSYDLVSAHRVIHGRDDLFRGCERHSDPRQIDSAEATRLLLNRCSGLLLVQERLLKPELSAEDCDFIGRNIAKAKLALGDSLLAAHGKYHWDCLERARRLGSLDNIEARPLLQSILKHHSAGISFKLHPVRVVKPATDFKVEHQELSELALREWLWIENRRLNASFSTLREYALSSIPKCNEDGAWRNLLLNIRTFGASASLDSCAPRYPRERLFNALPLLLGDERSATELDTRHHLQRQLRTSAQDWRGLVAAYKQVWSCYG